MEPPLARGYHGTSVLAAEAILSDGFSVSRNDYDWLGDGVYFFQDAPRRAWEWAVSLHGEQAAVLESYIHLKGCMDLLDISWFHQLTVAYDSFLAHMKAAGMSLPKQTSGAHRLDRYVINYLTGLLADHRVIVRCVRAAFIEGEPVYPQSALYNLAHVQIAVRDTALISGTSLFKGESP